MIINNVKLVLEDQRRHDPQFCRYAQSVTPGTER